MIRCYFLICFLIFLTRVYSFYYSFKGQTLGLVNFFYYYYIIQLFLFQLTLFLSLLFSPTFFRVNLPFPSYLLEMDIYIIFRFSSFLIYAFKDIHFPLSIALAASHELCYVIFFIIIQLTYCLISTLVPCSSKISKYLEEKRGVEC